MDRLRRRPLMIGCDLAACVLFASVPVAAGWGALTTVHLFVVALLTGTTTVFFRTAHQVYLPTLVATDDLLDANTRLIGTESAAQVVGPGIGGLVAQLFGAVGGILVDAASYAVSAACLFAIRTPEPAPVAPPDDGSLARRIASGLSFVGHDRYLRTLTISGAAANVALSGIQAVQVVFLVRVVGVSAGSVGVLIACVSLGGVLGAVLARRISARFGSARGFVLCEVVAAPFALLMPFTDAGPALAFFAVGGAAVGAGVVAGNVIKGSFRQAYCPPELLGRVLTTMQFVNLGAIPVGAVAGGALASSIGPRNTLSVMAVALIASSWLLLSGPMRKARDFPVRAAQPAAVAA